MIDKPFISAWIIAILLSGFVAIYDSRKYKKNTPYPPSKKKRNLFHRILLGLVAGIHYLHFIGTYNHKKYNTQVHYPETIECYIGVIFAGILLFAYLAFAWYLYSHLGIIGISILVVPIVLNIISIFIARKKQRN